MLRLLGLLFIAVGLLQVFAKDLAWELTQFRNSLEGKASERTEVWEISTTILGLVMAFGGLLLLVHP